MGNRYKLYRIAKQKTKETQDVCQAKRGLWKLPGHQTYLTRAKDVGENIDKRLRNRMEESEQQFGFIASRSTTDSIFVLRQVMEEYREEQEELHCILINLEKAYDRVPRQEVWYYLRLKDVEEKYIRLVQEMCDGSKTLLKFAAGDTEEFEVTVGLHQGSALSPFLFAVIIDCAAEKVQREAPWDMLFADDVVVSAETKEEVEQRLEL
ncbi:uncharacterized protein LOC134774012 [Penaeus indicus]|uniref:uncharacterized protein LOC134774012 n=1 Tax=Penaeus indicus TaxID=29960 RepID=UPI00300C27DF